MRGGEEKDDREDEGLPGGVGNEAVQPQVHAAADSFLVGASHSHHVITGRRRDQAERDLPGAGVPPAALRRRVLRVPGVPHEDGP